jgi:ABC-type nitrate/sulfonate/bicarbonate transport system ATPase subunit
MICSSVNLDFLIVRLLLDGLSIQMRDQTGLTSQTTVVLVTHDLREALYLADRVYVMRKRPGAAHAQIDVTLPRPRTQELTYESAFLDYLREGRSLLEEASA